MRLNKRILELEKKVKPRGDYTIQNIKFWDDSVFRMVLKGGKYLGQVNFKDCEVDDVHGEVPREFLEMGEEG